MQIHSQPTFIQQKGNADKLSNFIKTVGTSLIADLLHTSHNIDHFHKC